MLIKIYEEFMNDNEEGKEENNNKQEQGNIGNIISGEEANANQSFHGGQIISGTVMVNNNINAILHEDVPVNVNIPAQIVNQENRLVGVVAGGVDRAIA